MMKSNELRDKMSAIADLALSCDAKVGTFESRPHTEMRVDDGEKCAIVHHYAAKIALAALELCRQEELETVALALEKSILPVATMNEPVAENYLDFCRLKLARYGAAGMPTVLIGKRVNADQKRNHDQIFKIEVKRPTSAFPSRAVCTENGELLFELTSYNCFSTCEYAAVKTLKAFLTYRMRRNGKAHRAKKEAGK